jgi:hypothetical protein
MKSVYNEYNDIRKPGGDEKRGLSDEADRWTPLHDLQSPGPAAD